MAFTQNFNYCMEQRGYSAYKFAQIIGASNQGVLNWQSGDSKPYPKTQKKIADHFGITVEALNGEDLPALPPQDAKKAPTEISGRENISPAKQALLDAIDGLSEEQCEKLLIVVESAKKLL